MGIAIFDMMKGKYFIFTLLLLAVSHTYAQDYKRTQNWYFGDSAGLSFATDPPTVLTDGAMYAIEGCATMSDTNGNLLFYTNGVTVWNKNHQVMDNGTGLKGDASSTQGALIVPYPNNDSLFYLFIAYGWTDPNSGFYYSLININDQGGKGKVITKNILLQTPISEKLAAVHHRNGRDFWVITTDFSGNKLYSFFVGINGLVVCPVISSTPIAFSSLTAVGEMKISYSGKLIAVARHNTKAVDIMTFNNLNGTIQYQFSLEHPNPVYGVEFSISERYL